MSDVRRAVLLSLAQRYVAFVIQFAASIVMARLLSPHETGIFSIAASVVAIAHLLRDFGVSEYVIRERALTREHLRASLGVTLFMAWMLAGLLFVLAGPLARLYAEPGVEQVLQLLVINFMLLPMGSVAFAVLTKEMAMGVIFRVQTASALVGAGSGIALAAHGYSYMSMAWSSLAALATTIGLLAWYRPRETFLLPSLAGMGRIGRFGGTLVAGRLVDQLCRRAPDLLIGNGLGMAAVGLYSKANSLADAFHEFFAAAINRVALPAYARNQDDPASVRRNWLHSTRLMTVFPLAFYGFLALFAQPLVRLLFGPQWEGSAAVLRIVCLGSAVYAPWFLCPPLLTAHGHVGVILRMQVVGGAVMLPLYVWTSGVSVEAVAWVVLPVQLLKMVLLQRALRRHLDARLADVLREAAPSVVTVAAGLLAAAPTLLLYQHDAASALASLAAGSVAATGAGLIALFASHHPLAAELRRGGAWLRRRRRA